MLQSIIILLCPLRYVLVVSSCIIFVKKKLNHILLIYTNNLCEPFSLFAKGTKMGLFNFISFLLFRFLAPLPPSKQNVPLINKGPPASDDQTQITVAFNRFALCDDSNGKIVQWYIIVSKSPGVEGIYRVLNYMLKMLLTSIYLINIQCTYT